MKPGSGILVRDFGSTAALAMMLAFAPEPSATLYPQTAAPDSVVVVVSAESPIVEMSRLHLADLYLGRTNRFPDGLPAVPIDQRPESPARQVFYEQYLDRTAAEIKAHWSKLIFTGRGRPPQYVASGEAVKERLARDPSAVGYVDVRLVDESLRVVRLR